MTASNNVELRREVYASDVKQMAGWMADEEVTHFLNEEPNISSKLENLLKQSQMNVYTHHFNRESRFYLIDLKKLGRPVGYLRLIPKQNDKLEMVIAIGDKNKWNKGFGTSAVWEGLKEAFLNLRYEKVEAKIHKDNKASQKVFKKAGFENKENRPEKSNQTMQMTCDDFLDLTLRT